MAVLQEDLLAAYVSAVYEVEVQGRWIDAATLPLPGSADPAALISAWNPYSQILPERENAERHRQLQDAVIASGCRWWPARGGSADGAWTEPGFLVQATLAQIDGWAQAFGQHAVWMAPSSTAPASLRIYSAYAGTQAPAELGPMRIAWVHAPEGSRD